MKLSHKNVLIGVGQLVLTAGLTFFSIPVFIRTLGTEAYGAFSIVTLAGNLNIFANLGLNTTLLKFLSVQGKSRESDQDIVVTVGLLLLIMVPLSALVISQQAFVLQQLLGLSDSLYGRVTSLYRCVVLANLLLLLGQTATTVLDSQQRMYQTNLYQLIYSVLYWGGLIMVVSLGYDMAGVGLVILAAAVIWFGLVIAGAGRSWGRLQLGGLRTETRRIARKQLAFSANVYTAGLLSMLFEPMTKLLVARLIGVTEVGYLEIAYKVRSQLWSLVTKVTFPMYPKIAQETDTVRLSRFIGNYQTGMVLLIIPFLFFFAITLPDLLGFWLPRANRVVLVATLLISTAFTLNSLGILPYYFLMSRQYVGKTVWAQLTNAGVNLMVSLLTYPWLGIYGFVLGNSLAILSSLVLCLYYQKRYFGLIQIDTHQLRRLVVTVLLIGIPALLSVSQLAEPWMRIGVMGLSVLGIYGFVLPPFISLKTLTFQ